jgi:hypothetical protein
MWKVLCEYPDFCFVGFDSEGTWELGYFLTLKDHLQLANKFLFIIAEDALIFHDFPFEILDGFLNKCIINDKHFKLILLNLGEAPYYHIGSNTLLDKLKNDKKIPYQDMIIFSAGIKYYPSEIQVATSYQISLLPSLLVGTDVKESPTHHFISLCRVARKHRVMASIDILERGLDKYGYMSLGSAYNTEIHYDYLQHYMDLVPGKFQHRMPMLLDGTWEDGWSGTSGCMFAGIDKKITRAFVHLVLESSYQRPITNQGEGWLVPLISEKSMKPFAYGQIPLFLCFDGQVQHVRNMGFDLFDDVIDHSYDTEPNPFKRISLVIDQLQQICENWTWEQMQQFKSKNQHRYDRNQQIFVEWMALEPHRQGLPSLQKALDCK